MSVKLWVLLWILGVILFFSIIGLARYVSLQMPPSRGIGGAWALWLPFSAVLMLLAGLLAFSFTDIVRKILFSLEDYLEDRKRKTKKT